MCRRHRRTGMRKLAAIVAMAALVAGAIALDALSPEPAGASRLRPFASCDEVEAWFQEGAGQAGFGMGGDVGGSTDDALVSEATAAGGGGAGSDGAGVPAAAPAPEADSASSAQRQATDHSGTNLQEEAVDEPDIVKTDGALLVIARIGTLHVVDARSGRERSTLDLPGDPGGDELLLSGDRALVISRTWRPAPGGEQPMPTEPGAASGDMVMDSRMIAPGEEITRLTAVDLSDPGDPTVTATAELDGSYVSARMTGTSVRLVLQQWPQVADPAAATAEEWLPSITVGGGEPEPLAACDDVTRSGAHPTSHGTTSVVTLDVDGDLEPQDTDVIAASASTIYASERRLYVASQAWATQGPGGVDLHAFDTSSGASTGYLGSGRAEGRLLNQWALSERDGVLRVASTTDTDSRITTFRERGDALQQVGMLSGLGPTEQIYSVRYLGDLAFVVTFRQTDPLYTIDLSDPAAPRTLGELKVTGFSSYLHPVADGRLLGVGQEATEQGMTTGTAVSLFDVSDLAAPGLLDRFDLPGGHSPVEYDHKAFTWWAPTSTGVVPFERWDETGQRPETGAVVLDVSDSSITERGRVSHAGRPGRPQEWAPMIQRSIVVGDSLWTLSDGGLLASDLTSLDDRTWIDFPDPGFAEGGAPAPEPAPEG
jgi:uncharacterized secreted protein with C-terminal beta-propeller domain